MKWKVRSYHRHVSFRQALFKFGFALLPGRSNDTLAWYENKRPSHPPPHLPLPRRRTGSHHLALLFQDDGLPRPLPQAQGLVVGRGHDVVAIGADGQTPNLSVVTLRGPGGEKSQDENSTRPVSKLMLSPLLEFQFLMNSKSIYSKSIWWKCVVWALSPLQNTCKKTKR